MSIDGVPATLIDATDVAVTYQPQPGAPGDVPLEAIGPDGTAKAAQRLYPALGASTTGMGGTLHVEIDNGGVTAPAFAIYDLDGKWIIESEGVPPDIEVVDDPAEFAQGRDPQLERAIAEVLKELRAHPPLKVNRPKYPNRSGK